MSILDDLAKRTACRSLPWLLLMVPAACQFAAPDDARPSPPAPEKAEGVRFDPVVQTIEGWTVHVDPPLHDLLVEIWGPLQ